MSVPILCRLLIGMGPAEDARLLGPADPVWDKGVANSTLVALDRSDGKKIHFRFKLAAGNNE